MRSVLASSSPASQGGTSTNTPATRITASAPQTVANGGKDDDLSEALGGLTINTQSEDPFLEPSSAAGRGRMVSSLSPIASSFTPGGRYNGAVTVYQGQESNARHQTAFGSQVRLGTNNSAAQSFKKGTFTIEDDISRSMVVEAKFSDTERIKRIFHDLYIASDDYRIMLPVAGSQPSETAMTLIEFNDPQVAQRALTALRINLDSTRVNYCHPKVLTSFRGLDSSNTSDHEGELLVTAYFDELNYPMAEHELSFHVQSALLRFGPLKAFDRFPVSQTRLREFRVEFADIRTTSRALVDRHGIMTMGITLQWVPYQPDVVANTSASQSVVPAAAGFIRPSLTGRSMMPSAAAMSIPQNIISARGPRGLDNTINIRAILNGEDIRTTVMLRNIPNKVDCHMLKALLDETSYGQCDFAYLRIDFKNECNVGYAFINFSDALNIVPFARARQRLRWDMFGSDKVAEISYATIQDRANLIQKFRNSSVMLEHPDYRPKLFHTHPHILAGTEEKFPEPDNLQKMKRSIENAEHIGLFIPSRGSRRGGGYVGHNNMPPTSTSQHMTPTGLPYNMLPTGTGRRGYYAPPSRIGMGTSTRVVAPNTTFARPRVSPKFYTPPPTPIGQGFSSSRAVVPVNTPQDAFTDMRTIRAARRSPRFL